MFLINFYLTNLVNYQPTFETPSYLVCIHCVQENPIIYKFEKKKLKKGDYRKL